MTQTFEKSTARRWTEDEENTLLTNHKEPVEGRSVGACRIRLLKILNRKLDAGELTHEEIKDRYNVSEEQLDKDREISTKVAQKNMRTTNGGSRNDIIKQIKNLLEQL